jgi:hypothetical protein
MQIRELEIQLTLNTILSLFLVLVSISNTEVQKIDITGTVIDVVGL